MLVLKQQLKEARIPQAVVARAVDVSEATLAQIVNHNAWPPHQPRRSAPASCVLAGKSGD